VPPFFRPWTPLVVYRRRLPLLFLFFNRIVNTPSPLSAAGGEFFSSLSLFFSPSTMT